MLSLENLLSIIFVIFGIIFTLICLKDNLFIKFIGKSILEIFYRFLKAMRIIMVNIYHLLWDIIKSNTHILWTIIKRSSKIERILQTRRTIKYLWNSIVNKYLFLILRATHNIIRLYIEVNDFHYMHIEQYIFKIIGHLSI